LDIPLFIKNLGHSIIAYILNITEENAIKLFKKRFDLNHTQTKVLTSYIDKLQSIKSQNLDQEDSKWIIIDQLSNSITKDNEHLLNHYRRACGGIIPSIDTSDTIVKLVFKLAIEAYPNFLLKSNDNFNIGLSPHMTSLFYSLEESKILEEEILKDSSLKQLFSNGTDSINTKINYCASSGLAGSIQLIVFPSLIVSKIFELMTLKYEFSINDISKYTILVISMYRELSNNKRIKIPYFIGFENIGISNGITINDAFGTIYRYTKNTIEKLPINLRPSLFNNQEYLGFILETKFQYEIDLNTKLDKNWKFPDKFKTSHKEIEPIQDNLALAFIFSSKEKLTSISHRWSCTFDLLNQGTSISLYDRHFHTSNPTIYSEKEIRNVSYWYNIITKTNDDKIKIAKHRLLSATSKRTTNLDSFIDGIIALENIFGHGSGEIGFKLSMGVAFLLKDDSENIKELQKTVNKLYADRSKVLHGAIILTFEEEKNNKEKILQILIDCLKYLYQNNKLIDDRERGKTIIFDKTHNKALEKTRL